MLCAALATLLPNCTPGTLEDFTVKEGTVDVGASGDTDAVGLDTKAAADATEDVAAPTCEPGVTPCPKHTNPCRDFTCSANGQCQEELLKDGAFCEDGDPCTDDSGCIGGACKGGDDKDCDDDNPCTADSCDKATGKCAYDSAKDGVSCEPPQVECWNRGECAAGKCMGITALCKCHPEWEGDDDPITNKCAEWVDPEDKCLGRNFCKKVKSGYNCEANPATVVECSAKKDTQCRINECDVETGECEMKNVINPLKPTEPVACDDGDKCTNAEKCIDGQCKITDIKTHLVCKCTPSHLDNCINELGKNPCYGKIYCQDNKCEQTSKIVCTTADDTACLKRQCDAESGQCLMAEVNPGTHGGNVLCDDGDVCSPNDTCVDGVCAAGSPPLCPCTNDAGCTDKDDGNLCNGTLYCDKSGGGASKCAINPASVVNCATVNDTVCVRNFCYPKTGKCNMTPTKNLKLNILTEKSENGKDVKVIKIQPYPYAVVDFVACDDSNPCTVNDECIGASCQPGKTNVCKCGTDKDCLALDDGNLCNGVDYCDKVTGACTPNPSSVVTCSKTDNSQCLSNLCDPKKGVCALTPILEGKLCVDGNNCTKNEACLKGVCAANADIVFICGCKTNADCQMQEDGDQCNGTLYCDKASGFCQVNQATKVKCSSANDSQCQKNSCDKKTGTCKVVPVNEYLLCDDGDPCTPSPVCTGGKCYDETNICQCKTNADCVPYEDGNACSGTLFCDNKDGMCRTNPATVVTCLKGNDTECAANSCDAIDGKCKMKSVQDNVILCDDGNPCSQFDKCVSGKCASGTNTCQCVLDADCAVIDDGNLCDGTLFCDKSDPKAARCVPKPNSKVPCKPDDPASCITDVCNPKTGKCELKDKGACDDKDPCTLDACALDGADAGKCQNTPAPDGAGAGVAEICVGGKTVSVPLGMSLAPAGEFYMGCNPKLENCSAVPKDTQHKVTVAAVWMDRYEVTVARYQACIDGKGCVKPTMADPGCNLGQAGLANHPMNCLSQAQAKAFCTWDSGKRLPTEAEWAKSARGGCTLYGDDTACKEKTQTYVWGEAGPPDCDFTIMVKDGVGDGCGDKSTAEVASRAQTDISPYGLYDMAGNAREFVADYWDEDFYGTADATKPDPENKTAGSDIVVRGGGWKSMPDAVRAAYRGHIAVTTAGAVDLGFRCALTYK